MLRSPRAGGLEEPLVDSTELGRCLFDVEPALIGVGEGGGQHRLAAIEQWSNDRGTERVPAAEFRRVSPERPEICVNVDDVGLEDTD